MYRLAVETSVAVYNSSSREFSQIFGFQDRSMASEYPTEASLYDLLMEKVAQFLPWAPL